MAIIIQYIINFFVFYDQREHERETKLLSVGLLTQLDYNLKKRANNVHSREGEKVKLPCNKTLQQEVLKQIEERNKTLRNINYDLKWFHNNDTFVLRYNGSTSDKLKPTIELDKTLLIRHVEPRDRGVHICVGIVRRPHVKAQLIVFDIYALTVTSTVNPYDYEVYSGQTLKIPCYSSILLRLFNDLHQDWFLNKKRVENITMRSQVASLNLYYPKTKPTHSGVYECRVADRVNKLHWTTNKVKVKVVSMFWFIYSIRFWLFVTTVILVSSSIWFYLAYKKCQKISKYDALLNQDEENEHDAVDED